MRIAVVGAGIAGLTVSRILQSKHDVTVFENAANCGGNAQSVHLSDGNTEYDFDLGVSVFYRPSYPCFFAMMDRLGVETVPCNLSIEFAIPSMRETYNLDFSNPRRSRLLSMSNRKMLKLGGELERFKQLADSLDEDKTLGDFLAEQSFTKLFRVLMTSLCMSVWTMDAADVLDFPAQFVFRELTALGALMVPTAEAWRRVPGGVTKYIYRLEESLCKPARVEAGVVKVERTDDDKVRVHTRDTLFEDFDELVFAIPAERAFALLDVPNKLEREVLPVFKSKQHQLYLSRGALPQDNRKCQSNSIYFEIAEGPDSHLKSMYPKVAMVDLPKLTCCESETPYYLSHHGRGDFQPESSLQSWTGLTPSLTASVIHAQSQHAKVSGCDRIHYCGAGWGNGLHEAAIQSALNVTRRFGLELDAI